MTAEAISPDGTPIDYCQRCECAVIHEPIVCDDCSVEIALNDEEPPKPMYRAGQIDALRRVDWAWLEQLVSGQLESAKTRQRTAASMAAFFRDRGGENDGMIAQVKDIHARDEDSRIAHASESLTAIRALRKELGL